MGLQAAEVAIRAGLGDGPPVRQDTVLLRVVGVSGLPVPQAARPVVFPPTVTARSQVVPVDLSAVSAV